jgi:hypothetical protein
VARETVVSRGASVEELDEAAHLAQMSDDDRIKYWWEKKALEKFVAAHPEYTPNRQHRDLLTSTAHCYGVTIERAYEILKQEGSI